MSRDGTRDAFGLYLAVPFCRAKCSYCNFASGVFPAALQADYCRALLREIDLTLAALDLARPPVDTIYWGGGTPTLLAPEQIAALAAGLRERFAIAPGAEFTVEAMPGTLPPEVLAALAAAGVNRVSLGVQSFVAAEARAVGRRQPPAAVLADLAHLRAAGIANINLDLIAGLPGQTPASWRESLAAAIAADAPHISIYMLEVDDDSRLGRELRAGGARYHAPAVPDDDAIAEQYESACALLARGGYRQYEISNFARPGGESRHNERYWLRRPYLGFGLDAHSFTGAERWGNADDLDAYLAALAADRLPRRERCALTPRMAREETLFLGLRRNAGVAATAFAGFETALAELAAAGLLAAQGERVALTPRGRLLSNEVFARFL